MSDCERAEFSTERCVTANKEHQCCECKRPIKVGENYVRCTLGGDGAVDTYKQHLRCYHFARWLNYVVLSHYGDDECIGFGYITEELNEYLPEADPAVFDLWHRVQHGLEFRSTPGWMAHHDAEKKWLEKVAASRRKGSVTMIDQRPVVAFLCAIEGFTDFYVAATCPGKARHIAVSSMKEAGYTESAQYKNVRVSRAKKFDEWAKTAKRGCFSHDAVLVQMGISGTKLL